NEQQQVIILEERYNYTRVEFEHDERLYGHLYRLITLVDINMTLCQSFRAQYPQVMNQFNKTIAKKEKDCRSKVTETSVATQCSPDVGEIYRECTTPSLQNPREQNSVLLCQSIFGASAYPLKVTQVNQTCAHVISNTWLQRLCHWVTQSS